MLKQQIEDQEETGRVLASYKHLPHTPATLVGQSMLRPTAENLIKQKSGDRALSKHGNQRQDWTATTHVLAAKMGVNPDALNMQQGGAARDSLSRYFPCGQLIVA